MSLILQDVAKTYKAKGRRSHDVMALGGVSLDVGEDEVLVVVGPSGSGKSTLLRCIAGLEDVDRGTIEVGGRDVTESQPSDRDVAMVFQDLALYPHLHVEGNISFGLRARKVGRDQIEIKVKQAAELLELGGVLHRMPSELSGGERQRVALARCIVRAPKVFLLDEPLSNLDTGLRHRTRVEIRALQRALGVTMVYVTHDQNEAMTMGDRVAILRDGLLEQIGAPMDLYDSPISTFVAHFLGDPPMNIVPGEVLGVGRQAAPIAGIRPEDLRLSGQTAGRVSGTVEAVERLGSETIVHVGVGAETLMVRTGPGTEVGPGGPTGLSFQDEDIHLFDAAGAAIR